MIANTKAKNNRLKELEKPLGDFRSLDEYLDYCGLEPSLRPAYRQAIIRWLKLSDQEKARFKHEQ